MLCSIYTRRVSPRIRRVTPGLACLFIDLVHRDIKPENILLVKSDTDPFDIRVSLCRIVPWMLLSSVVPVGGLRPVLLQRDRGHAPGLLWDPSLYGYVLIHGVLSVVSAVCLAPEVLKNRAYSDKCDIWSIGVIMYQL